MKTSKAMAVLGTAAVLGLTGCTQTPGRTAALSTDSTGPPSIVRVVQAAAERTASPGPASVVEDFYAAINSHDYRRAWDLGGSHLGQSYARFAAGFADTAADAISIDSVAGDRVDVHLHAVHTDGSTADYAGSYTVVNGTITHGSLHRVSSGASTSAPAAGSLNPAVTPSTIHSTICVRGWTATIRPPAAVTEHLKRQQLAASHAADKNPRHYEEDHIVPLELGGAPDDPANLRPVPLTRADADDRLENTLHRAVCRGTLTLSAARTTIEQAKASEGLP